MATQTTDVLTFRVTGEHESDSSMTGRDDLLRKCMLPTVEPVEIRVTRKPGKRKHKQAQTVNHDGAWSVPVFASQVLPRKCTTAAKASSKGKGFSVTIGEDGCSNISVRGHLARFGYTSKNKHTQPAPATEFSPGKVISNAEHAWELVSITLEKQGNTRYHTATCVVWNVEAKAHKRIVLPRVMNKKQAIIALRTIHQIDC